MRLLGNLLYSSPEFRKLLNDVTIVSRDIFADAASFAANVASSAAEKARPEEDISEIEKPAESAGPDIPSTSQMRSMAKDKGISYADALRKQTHQSRYDMESYLREKFPKQRRDAVINRLKGSISEIQKNEDFNRAVDFLLEMAQNYIGGLVDSLTKETSAQKPTVRTDEHFDRAVQDLKAIIMVFADGKSLDDIHSAAKKVIEDIQSDEDLHNFYRDVFSFLNRALKQMDFITSDAADAEAHELYDRSTRLLQEKRDAYQPDMEALFQELTSFLTAISQDRENRRVIEASKKVFNDLVILDSRGNFKGFKRRIVRDMLDVLLPRLLGEVRYVPIPRVEYQDRDYDLILENLILESDHFIPYRTIFETVTRAEFINEYIFTSKYSGTSKLRLQGITMYAKDMAFVVRKKTGLVTYEDRGFLDIYLDGRGADAEVVLESHSEDDDDYDDDNQDVYGAGGHYFSVKSVKVNIHNFRYKYNAYHTWAAALLSPIVRPMVRKLVASILEQKIKQTFELADREIRGAAERMRIASIATSGSGGGSLEGWIRAILSRPPAHKSSRAGGDRRGGGGYRVNIGDDEIFPGEFPPGGIVGKIKDSTERVGALGEEGGWRNDVFDLRT
ncbi:hypothetical protein L873DRAFT_1683147 [Choiromyces venosus 120613-1]|uniref:HAM1-like N-terminal domain-containing protein n=1 Tax=Choiromyces venosus 120613-1 TaxID=1336337 RepID=A0A3N4JMX3_9PEZI|nr:hypothetical protein L873DRAFT_1683147 [Choiromyces venosus 120613-1]